MNLHPLLFIFCIVVENEKIYCFMILIQLVFSHNVKLQKDISTTQAYLNSSQQFRHGTDACLWITILTRLGWC